VDPVGRLDQGQAVLDASGEAVAELRDVAPGARRDGGAQQPLHPGLRTGHYSRRRVLGHLRPKSLLGCGGMAASNRGDVTTRAVAGYYLCR